MQVVFRLVAFGEFGLTLVDDFLVLHSLFSPELLSF